MFIILLSFLSLLLYFFLVPEFKRSSEIKKERKKYSDSLNIGDKTDINLYGQRLYDIEIEDIYIDDDGTKRYQMTIPIYVEETFIRDPKYRKDV